MCVGVKEGSVTCTSIYTRAVRSKQEVGQPSGNEYVRLGIQCTHALMLCVCLKHACLSLGQEAC